MQTTHTQTTPRGLRNGVLLWLVFGAAAVALRGVRWDEDYEFAQAILRSIPYPEGHPLFQYTRGMFSVQPYSLAALMTLFPGPLLAKMLGWITCAGTSKSSLAAPAVAAVSGSFGSNCSNPRGRLILFPSV